MTRSAQRTCSLAGQAGKVVHICHMLGASLQFSRAQHNNLKSSARSQGPKIHIHARSAQRTCSLAGQGGKVVHICHALGASLLSSGAQHNDLKSSA